MNFLFTVALNNNETPHNYKSIMQLMVSLASTLQDMGHNTFILSHSQCLMIPEFYKNFLVVDTLNNDNYESVMSQVGFTPDYSFIWNGNLPSDQQTIAILKQNGVKIVYGELGFLNHYGRTCYFDLSGVNCRISSIGKPIEDADSYDAALHERLFLENLKPRLVMEPYIFVPLQVESDTQITKYSPFKTMDQLLEYVSDIFAQDDRKILYKQHPHLRANVRSYDKFVEVSEDVHHYIPYADVVVGINSTVLVETLLYHDRIISLGAGVTSKHVRSDIQRKKYILDLYSRQLNWGDLSDRKKVENSGFYQDILKDYNKCKV